MDPSFQSFRAGPASLRPARLAPELAPRPEKRRLDLLSRSSEGEDRRVRPRRQKDATVFPAHKLPHSIIGHIGRYLDDKSRWAFANTRLAIHREICSNPFLARAARDGAYRNDLSVDHVTGFDRIANVKRAAELLLPEPHAAFFASDDVVRWSQHHESWRSDLNWRPLYDDFGPYDNGLYRLNLKVVPYRGRYGQKLTVEGPQDTLSEWQLHAKTVQKWETSATWSNFDANKDWLVAYGARVILRLETAGKLTFACTRHFSSSHHGSTTAICSLPFPVVSPVVDDEANFLVARAKNEGGAHRLVTLQRDKKSFTELMAPLPAGSPQKLYACPFSQQRFLWARVADATLDHNIERFNLVFRWIESNQRWQRVSLPAEVPDSFHSIEYEPRDDALLLTYFTSSERNTKYNVVVPLMGSERTSPQRQQEYRTCASYFCGSIGQKPRAVLLHSPIALQQKISFLSEKQRLDTFVSQSLAVHQNLLYVSRAGHVAAIVSEEFPSNNSGEFLYRLRMFAEVSGSLFALPAFHLPKVQSLILSDSTDPLRFAAYCGDGQVIAGFAETNKSRTQQAFWFTAVSEETDRPAGMAFTRDGERLLVVGGKSTNRYQTKYRIMTVDSVEGAWQETLLRNTSQTLRLLDTPETADGRRMLLGDNAGQVVSVLPAHFCEGARAKSISKEAWQQEPTCGSSLDTSRESSPD